MSVSTGGGGAPDPGPGRDGDPDPITVDPGKGWLITLPVPAEVVAKLGGPDRLGERLRPIMAAKLDHFGELAPDASDKLAAAYDELIQHLAQVTGRERQQ